MNGSRPGSPIWSNGGIRKSTNVLVKIFVSVFYHLILFGPVYERRLGNTKKPQPDTADRDVEQFIRQKYEQKAFMEKSSNQKSKSKSKHVSSEEESDEDSDEDLDSDSSEENPPTRAKHVGGNKSTTAVSSKQQIRSDKQKSASVTASVTSDFDKIAISSANGGFAKFDAFPSDKPNGPASTGNDFAQFGEFFGSDTPATSSAPASSDKDFIMSLFQGQTQATSYNQGSGFPQGPPGFNQQGMGKLPSPMGYSQPGPAVGGYPQGSIPSNVGYPQGTIPSTPFTAPVVQSGAGTFAQQGGLGRPTTTAHPFAQFNQNPPGPFGQPPFTQSGSSSDPYKTPWSGQGP